MRLLISGGGTGGHVYPLLTVVEALKSAEAAAPDPRRGASAPSLPRRSSPPVTADGILEILYIGSHNSVEERLAERAGLSFRGVETGQLRGKAPWTMAGSLLRMWRGVRGAQQLIREFGPGAALITGGYVSVPVAVAARREQCPVMIYLPDLTPGLAVRWLGKLATQIAVTFPETERYFPGKAFVSGYPVREALVQAGQDPASARKAFGLEADDKTLLAFGGSSGARSINQALVKVLPELLDACQIIHVSGSPDWSWIKQEADALPARLRARYRPFEYLHEEMAQALGAADLILSRAGAAVLGEYTALGRASVLVPYPHAGRHQEANARYLASRGAAVVLDDSTLGVRLRPTLLSLLADETARQKMQSKALALARYDSAQRMGAALAKLAGSRRDQTLRRG